MYWLNRENLPKDIDLVENPVAVCNVHLGGEKSDKKKPGCTSPPKLRARCWCTAEPRSHPVTPQRGASCPETLWQRCRCPAPVKWRNAASAQTATQHMSEEAMSRPRRRQHGFDCQLKIPGPKLLTRSVVSLGFPCDTEEPLTGHALGQRNCENQSPTSFRPISKSHTLHVGQ